MKAWIIICILVAVAIAAAVFFYKLGKSLANMSRCGCKEKRSRKVSHNSHFKSANMIAGEIVLAYPLCNY